MKSKLMKEILKISADLDEVVKEVTDYETFSDLLDLDTDEFMEELDKVMDKLKEMKEESTEDKIKKGVEEVKKFKEKHGVVEKETGVMFKVYDTEKDGHTGVCVEARGEIADVLHYATKGMGEILKEHDFTLDDLDGIVSAFRSTIRRELLKGGK